jgi:competence protein ComEA
MSGKFVRSALALLLLAAASARAGETAAAPTQPEAAKVNINQASAAQIALLPRIGAKVAERVVEYRKEHGSFSRPEELMEVKGIGEKLFLILKPHVTVSGPTTATEKIRSGSAGASARGASARKAPVPAAPVGKGR